MQTITNITVHQEKIDEFCQNWHIVELALFGSVLRDDFTAESDIDILVTFEPGSRYRFADLMQMEAELKLIFGHDVDLGTWRSVEEDANYLRRRAILNSAQVIYAT